MADRFAQLRKNVEESVLRGPAASEASVRQAAHARDKLPADLATLLAKVHDHAYKVTDEEVAALRGKYNDDQLYEIIVSAAVGAAGARLDAGLSALDAAETKGGEHAVAKT